MKPIYVSPDEHLRLKKLAGSSVRTIQSLTTEALHLLFARYQPGEVTDVAPPPLEPIEVDSEQGLEAIAYGEQILNYLHTTIGEVHLEELQQNVSGRKKLFYTALEHMIRAGKIERREGRWNDGTRAFFWTPKKWAARDEIRRQQEALKLKHTPAPAPKKKAVKR